MIKEEIFNDEEFVQDEDFAPTQYSKRKRNQNRPKITDAWPNENVVKLISEVEVRPCIWNVGDREYKNHNKRYSAWNEISVVFDNKIAVEQLSAKWQNLRTQFRTSLANAKKTKSGQLTSAKPCWRFHSQMSFTRLSVKNQKSVRCESNKSNTSILEDVEDELTTASDSDMAQRQDVINSDKKDEIIVPETECLIDRLHCLQQPEILSNEDQIQSFGNYFVSQLRNIKDAQYREITQRHLLQLLWKRIDEEPVKFNKY